MDAEPHAEIHLQCSAHHANTAYFPFTHQLWQATGFARDDPVERRLEKLETCVAAVVPLAQRDVVFVRPFG